MIKLFIEKTDFLIYYLIKLNQGITAFQLSEKLAVDEDYVINKINQFVDNNIDIEYDYTSNNYYLSNNASFHFSITIGEKNMTYDEETILMILLDEKERYDILRHSR